MKLRNLLACAVALSVAAVVLTPAVAQDYPNRPVKVIVGYAPGGGTDIFARLIADKLGRVLGQPVLVDNKAGANGIIGADQVAKSPADGYSLVFVVNTHVTNVDMYASMPFDPIKDFSPVGLVVSTPLLLISNPGFAPTQP